MTKVDFYILEQSAPHARLHFATRLTEKLYREGHRIHIHTDDPVALSAVDQYLWTDRDISFIPHEQANKALTHCPVTLGNQTFHGTDEILINLAQQVPDFFSQFKRVLEIIDSSEEVTQSGRQRYTFYRDRGYPLTNHKMN